MSSAGLIPQAFWFRLAVPCRRIDKMPIEGDSGRLLDLPESCRLIRTPMLEGKVPWSEVRAAWNPQGLAFQVEVTGKISPIYHDRYMADASDGLQLWIDTRDTRDVHRATRFCHRFSAVLVPDKAKRTVGVQFEQKPIHRGLADAPLAKPESVQARAEKTRGGWRLELFLGASALNGFDPDTNRRMGLAYQVTDPDRGDEFLTVGRDFPIGEDPSLWATLELQD
ncbi:MAG: hypothetical protein JWN86_647 [Planctomycetota bacterium]|nr:hypothetical protein [Planctomycetota bacterium]